VDAVTAWLQFPASPRLHDRSRDFAGVEKTLRDTRVHPKTELSFPLMASRVMARAGTLKCKTVPSAAEVSLG
jgi:hypothetical protein